MYRVEIPGSLAWSVEKCHESPWGTVEVFNSVIFQWLDDHAGPTGWDHDLSPCGQNSIVEIQDPKVALLFKLVWGGK
jgi:hypothetical protein